MIRNGILVAFHPFLGRRRSSLRHSTELNSAATSNPPPPLAADRVARARSSRRDSHESLSAERVEQEVTSQMVVIERSIIIDMERDGRLAI